MQTFCDNPNKKFAIYQRLRSQTSWAPIADSTVRQSLDLHWHCVLVRSSTNKVIGCARLIGDSMYGYVQDLIVDESFRGRGIGTALLNEILIFARAQSQ